MWRSWLLGMIIYMSMLPMASSAQEDKSVERFNKIAESLFSQLPMDGRYSIRNLTENSTGIPKDFLLQVSADIQAALLLASDFNAKFIDQAQLKGAWREAVEFNGADFEELVENTQFTATLIFNIRAVENGFQITGQAIGANSGNAGQVIASTPRFEVTTDWESESGINVQGTNERFREIQRQIVELKSAGGIVENPRTFAEHYHNANIFRRQGNLQFSMQSYENALLEEAGFVDVVVEITEVATQIFGASNAKNFIEKRVKPKVDEELFKIALLVLTSNESIVTAENFTQADINFGPLAAQWLWGPGQLLLDARERSTHKLYEIDYALLTAARIVINSYESGQFQSAFADSLKASELARIDDARNLEKRLNRVEYSLFVTNYNKGTGSRYVAPPAICNYYVLPLEVFWKTPEENTLNARRRKECSRFYNYEKSLNNVSAVDQRNLWSLRTEGAPPNNPKTVVESEFEREMIALDKVYPGENASSVGPCFRFGDTGFENSDVVGKQPIIPLKTETMPPEEFLSLFPQEYLADSAFQFPVISPATDRILFGDDCLEENRQGRIFGIAELVITDNVDFAKPVYLEFVVDSGSDAVYTMKLDVSADGTFFSPHGVPVLRRKGEGMVHFPFAESDWAYAPGIVQGSVGNSYVFRVTYTDLVGHNKSIDRIFLHASKAFLERYEILSGPAQSVSVPGFGPKLLENGISLEGSKDWSQERNLLFQGSQSFDATNVQQDELSVGKVAFLSAGDSCWVPDSVLEVVNVKNFVNLRAKPGFDEPVVEEVALGEVVLAIDQASVSFFGKKNWVDYCNSACEQEKNRGRVDTDIRAALTQCMANNVMWYQVGTSRDRTGYISGKFLGAQNSN